MSYNCNSSSKTAQDIPCCLPKTWKIYNTKRKNLSITYFARDKKKKFRRVCQKAFCEILNISKNRIQRICRSHISTGRIPYEKCDSD